MKHLGDITKIDGHKVPLVDIITGGSPCQDLSVAGKRAGLEGARSGLFMEQIRVTKEMRNESIKQLRLRGADIDIRSIQPRYFVWENVPGAFSSNKGEDFRAVLEETAKIVCEDAIIPRPENGKWTPSGVILGDGWSIAWRIHDAQFWGVPQRRKRIALVADFGGNTAPKILFESEGLPGDFTESREKGQGIADTFKRNTIKTISQCWDGTQTSPTLTANNAGGSQRKPDKENFNAVITYGVDCYNQTQSKEVTKSLNSAATDSDHIPCVYGLDRASFNQGQNAQYDFSIEEETAQTIVSRGPGGVLATNQAIGGSVSNGRQGSCKTINSNGM